MRITVATTVASADVTGALAEAWQAFSEAARDNPCGWDPDAAAAEVGLKDRDDVPFVVRQGAEGRRSTRIVRLRAEMR